MNNKRMTWAEIKQAYPGQHVGLIDIIEDDKDVLTAIVRCSSKDTDIHEMHELAVRGEIKLKYTWSEDSNPLGALML